MASEIFKALQKKVKPENKQFVDKNLAISRQVRHILAIHPSINTQKDLAIALKKEPSEISKWLNGFHNIGLENITKMEAVLGRDIILTDEQAKEKYGNVLDSNYKNFERIHFSGRIASHSKSVVKGTLVPTHPSMKKGRAPKKDSSKVAY